MKTLFITPPMTQLNTPYPATAYLTGFLRHQGFQASQRDLSIDIFLSLLSEKGLNQIFDCVEDTFSHVDDNDLPDAIHYFFSEFDGIQTCLPATLNFLQGKDPSLAMRIVGRQFLPEGPAFSVLHTMQESMADCLQSAFGELGIQDKAKYLATLFINDLVKVIQLGVDPLFEVSRYAERLASSNPSFDDLHQQLHAPTSLIGTLIHHLIEHYLQQEQPDILAISVPFPGNMLGALQVADSCRQFNPNIKIVLGGGFVNTELRSLSDPRLFDYVDFITLDNGERPLLCLIEHLQGRRDQNQLHRTYFCRNNKVIYQAGQAELTDFPISECGLPTYEGLKLDNYLSLCEMLNPMHRLWSDGHWNKLTIAHGCYWKKCSFCDINLDYIGNYQPATIEILITRIESLIAESGQRGFHFVDEAAPPKLLFALAEALIERGIVISWWGNIRFEKSFTLEKCKLLADAGCIAVSGGLEVASDRLLKLMQKGVTVSQVARVTHAFAEAGILVHAYLMYGFPSQTEAETAESLEWVRQMMLNGCFQSAYWHRFAATVHSPVGRHPEQFNVQLMANKNVRFAENDIDYIDPVSTDHALLGQGLNKAVYNYMHGMGFEYPVNFWFDKTLDLPDIDPDFIAQQLQHV